MLDIIVINGDISYTIQEIKKKINGRCFKTCTRVYYVERILGTTRLNKNVHDNTYVFRQLVPLGKRNIYNIIRHPVQQSGVFNANSYVYGIIIIIIITIQNTSVSLGGAFFAHCYHFVHSFEQRHLNTSTHLVDLIIKNNNN